MNAVKIEFSNTAERDNFLDQLPHRKCTDVPGLYRLGRDFYISVLALEVTIWVGPKEQD
jgi:hypothetical protein